MKHTWLPWLKDKTWRTRILSVAWDSCSVRTEGSSWSTDHCKELVFFQWQSNKRPVTLIHPTHYRFLACGSVWSQGFWLSLWVRLLQSCHLQGGVLIFIQLFTELSQGPHPSKAIPFCFKCLYWVLCHLWIFWGWIADNPCVCHTKR